MIEYRKATIEDFELLLRVRMDFLRNTQDVYDGESSARLEESNRGFLDESLSSGSFVEWIATDGHAVVATSSVSFYKLPPKASRPSGQVAYIGNMFTYPEYQRQGVASKLFELTLLEAKERGCGEILLDASEMGRPLYEKYGFIDSEETMKLSDQKR